MLAGSKVTFLASMAMMLGAMFEEEVRWCRLIFGFVERPEIFAQEGCIWTKDWGYSLGRIDQEEVKWCRMRFESDGRLGVFAQDVRSGRSEVVFAQREVVWCRLSFGCSKGWGY